MREGRKRYLEAKRKAKEAQAQDDTVYEEEVIEPSVPVRNPARRPAKKRVETVNNYYYQEPESEEESSSEDEVENNYYGGQKSFAVNNIIHFLGTKSNRLKITLLNILKKLGLSRFGFDGTRRFFPK